MPYELSDEETASLLNVATPVLKDSEGSFWKWDPDLQKYRILNSEGAMFPLNCAPAATRANIDRLYGPTELVGENVPLQTAVQSLFQGLRNGFIID